VAAARLRAGRLDALELLLPRPAAAAATLQLLDSGPALLDRMASALAPLIASIAALSEKIDKIDIRLGAVESRLGAVESRLGAVESRLGGVESRLGGVESRLGAVESRLGAVESRLDVADALRENEGARLANRHKALTAQLVPLPSDLDGRKWPEGVSQPFTRLALAVSGSEAVPGTSSRSAWSCRNSRLFLRASVPGYDEDDGSDAMGESGSKSGVRRGGTGIVGGGSDAKRQRSNGDGGAGGDPAQ